MKDKRFIEALDRLNIRDSRREELLGEILLRAEAEEREQKYMKKSRRSGRRGASPWRALAPIFAVVLIIGAVLLVPSVGEAVSGWFGRLFDRNKYLGTLPENRASMPDVEAAIQIPKDNEQDYTIYTLDETDEAAEFAAARANLGFDPYDPKDWQWRIPSSVITFVPRYIFLSSPTGQTLAQTPQGQWCSSRILTWYLVQASLSIW